MGDLIQHGFIGKIIALVFVAILSAIGITIGNSVLHYFLITMFIAGALPDFSYLWDWNKYGLPIRYEAYHMTHVYLTRWKVHIWLPWAWAYNAHILYDRLTHDKGKRWWVPTEFLIFWILIWIIIILIIF